MTGWQENEQWLAGARPVQAQWATPEVRGECFTGVGATISVAHDSPEGARHGHDYDITVWYRFGSDARRLLSHLDTVLDAIDHKVLPPEISLGEHLARHIARELPGAVVVDIERKTRRGRIFARWIDRAALAAFVGEPAQGPRVVG